MKGKIHNILNKELSKNNIKLLLSLGFIFVFLVGIVSYTIANNKSYALFENQATGNETLTIHYEEENPITVLFADGTLIINEKPSKRSANITAHGAVSHEYPGMREQGTDVQKYIFEDETDQPWNADAASITKVEMGQKVYPVSTAYWFYGLTHMSEGDFTNLSTKKVKDMKNMFYQAGYDSSVTSFRLIGLSSWDTSKVENMWAMFLYAGYYATAWDIGDLSAWNTSKVTRTDGMFLWAGYNATTFSIGNLSEWTTTKVVNMQSMFQECGYNSTAWSVGDLSGWDVSSVTNMNNLFYQAAYSATTFSVGNLDNWDTLNVTDMQAMFFQAGRNATTWNVGNLSNWNTSKVVTMHQMFFNAGQNTTTWSIGSLSGWDTSKVTDMQYMFCGAGYNTSTFSLNLANWDVSNVEIMSYMFQDSGYSATTWEIGNLTNWNTTNVTTMESMFYRAGYNATTWNSIGTLKTYADNISYMFNNCTKAKATLNLYSNPDETNYHNIFGAAATASGALITVNYRSSVTNINAIIATKSSNSNVVKGSVIS